MKRIIIISIVLVTMVAATDTYAQGFGVKGSFDFFNLSQKNASDVKIENKMIPSFDAGVFAEFPIAPEFFIRPELLFAQKGAKFAGSDEIKASLSYVQLPLMFLYKGGLGSSKVLLGFGPYLAYGVGGKMTGNAGDLDFEFAGDPGSTPTAYYLKPFDFGAQMMAGYEFGVGLSVAINASLGLSDIQQQGGLQAGHTTKNTGFGLTLGYRFGKN